MFTTEGHPLPVTAALQRKRDPPHQHRPPGNQTTATMHNHPFYQRHATNKPFGEAVDLSWTHNLVLEQRLSEQLSQTQTGTCSSALAGDCACSSALAGDCAVRF